MPGPVMPRATSGLGDVLRRLGIQLPVTPEASARQPWQDMPGSQPRPVLDNILGALVDFPRGMVTGGAAEPGMSWENAGAIASAMAPILGVVKALRLVHGSPDLFPNARPDFPAYYGNAEFQRAFQNDFGPYKYELKLSPKEPVLDLQAGTPEARGFSASMARQAYPNDDAFAQSLLDGTADEEAIRDFYEVWADKANIWKVMRDLPGVRAVKYQDEYLLSPDLIAESPAKRLK